MDTISIIIAVASPSGRSLHGIVRLSGSGALALLGGHLRAEDRAPLSERGSHVARVPLGADTVPAIVLTFPGPASYTGEDAAEIQLPGNDVLLNRVIDDLLDAARRAGAPARRAEPGEFTARAWLNGRLDLTQAEGVATLVAARSDAELRAGRLLIEGRLGRDAIAWADRIASTLALVEAGIDFTDQEDVVPITPADLRGRLDAVYREIGKTLARATGSERLEAIPWVVLRGAPNTGKSTLFNALLGHERAVVADVAGTTRDALAEPMLIETPRGPAEIMLADVAGEDEDDAQDELESLMQETARDTRRRADLVLLCAPAGAQGLPPVAEAEHTLVVRTKCDLAPPPPDAGLGVSARDGTGLARLREAIATRLADRAVSIGAACIVLRPRHDAALRAAHDHVAAALDLVEHCAGEPALTDPELIAASLRAALDELGAIAGSISPDEILGRVFATFCVGK